MFVLNESKTSLVSGGVNILGATKVGAQIGGVVGVPVGALLGIVVAIPTFSTAATLGFPLIGGFAGFYLGAASLAAVFGGTALVIDVTVEIANLIYS